MEIIRRKRIHSVFVRIIRIQKSPWLNFYLPHRDQLIEALDIHVEFF